MTTRGFKESDILELVNILHKIVKLALEIQEKTPSKLLTDFTKALSLEPFKSQIDEISNIVHTKVQSFPLP